MSSYQPDCPYADKCSDKGEMCLTCKHNRARKKSYYESDYPPMIWYPQPYVLPDYTITCKYS